MRYARLTMTHHGNPEPACFSTRLHAPTTAQCNRPPSVIPGKVVPAGQTAGMSFDPRASAVN